MQDGYSILNFVPIYIFAPMVLIGVLELLRTPSSRTDHERSNASARDPSATSMGNRTVNRAAV